MICIRTDGNSKIGFGHIVRCLSLAQMLKSNYDITFFCKEIPEIFQIEFNKNKIGLIQIDSEDQFISDLKEKQIVILDGYNFDTDYQIQIKSKGCKLIVIDDLHNHEIFADLIINHAPGTTPQDYIAQPFTQFALGLDYALLRPPFLTQAKKQRIIENFDTVIICFGGADPRNLTKQALEAAIDFSHFKKIIVVINSSNAILKKLNPLLNDDPRIDLRMNLNADEMLETILEAQISITPSSGILLEVIAAGCIPVSGLAVDNQKYLYENFKKSFSIYDAEDFTKEKISSAISKALSLSCVNVITSRIIDGKSDIRNLKLVNQLDNENFLNLRRVNKNDIEITYKWTSDKEIRKYSFQQHKICIEEHSQWFNEKIANPLCYYYIAEFNAERIGSIRFDIKEEEAIISFLIDSHYHGHGFGSIILKKGIEKLLQENYSSTIRTIVGEVMAENIPSVKAFERLGFRNTKIQNKYLFKKII